MELKEAKEILTDMFLYRVLEEKEEEAIETVLNELDNSIPKAKITSMLKHYEECEEMYGNLHGRDTYSDGVVIDKICEVLRKLLEEE